MITKMKDLFYMALLVSKNMAKMNENNFIGLKQIVLFSIVAGTYKD